MASVLNELVGLLDGGEKVVVSFVAGRLGSLPMSRTARLVLRGDGSIIGTIGGGCLEARVQGVSIGLLDRDRPAVLEITLTEAEAARDGLICGGVARIFVEPVSPGSNEADVYRAAGGLIAANGNGVIVTLISTGDGDPPRSDWKCLVVDGRVAAGTIAGFEPDELAGMAAEAAGSEKPITIKRPHPAGKTPEVEIHLEPIGPPESLYLFGAGHVAVPLARIAKMVGFELTVIDDREEFANRERFPMADRLVVSPFETVFDRLAVDDRSYIVIITRGHNYDELVAAGALKTPARYIGMIGSRHKIKIVQRNLTAAGLAKSDLERLHAPIGIGIGSDTPEEIAVSIAAEMIRIRRLGE